MRNAIVLIFLAITAPAMSHTLTVIIVGNGTTIPAGAPAPGITHTYPDGFDVEFTVMPDPGWIIESIDSPGPFTMNSDITVTVTFSEIDCVKSSAEGGNAQHYADWLGIGKPWDKPDCWCYKYHCRGDADGSKIGFYRIQVTDLNIFLSAFNKFDGGLDPEMICADFDHKKIGFYRVQTADLSILLSAFNKFDAKIAECPMDWDGDGDDDYNFWITP